VTCSFQRRCIDLRFQKYGAFSDENSLDFIGFSVRKEIREQFLTHFPVQAEGDLRLWDKFEAEYPDTFAAMYEFWAQKKAVSVSSADLSLSVHPMRSSL
jgi:hypothetical protein